MPYSIGLWFRLVTRRNERITVGGKTVTETIKNHLDIKAFKRKILEIDDGFHIRKEPTLYIN